jgi:hypothetical protein
MPSAAWVTPTPTRCLPHAHNTVSQQLPERACLPQVPRDPRTVEAMGATGASVAVAGTVLWWFTRRWRHCKSETTRRLR